MLQLINSSQYFSFNLYTGYDQNQQHQLTCVIKAGWQFDAAGKLTLLASAPSIAEIDQYQGKPGYSSLLAANEIMAYKTGGEILLYGTAQPATSNSTVGEVSITVHSSNKTWQKKLCIFGPRYWQSVLIGHIPSKPQLLQPLPLRYEYAYGGFDSKTNEYYPANPAGIGFANQHAKNLILPQIETNKFINKITDRPQPAGFGPTPVSWQLAGKKITAPIAPSNMAPIDQRFSEPFIGNEKITLQGFVNIPAFKIITLDVPVIKPKITLTLANDTTTIFPVCDTVIINTDIMQMHLVWRAGIPWHINDQRKGIAILEF